MTTKKKTPQKTGKEPEITVRRPGKPSKGDDARNVTFHAKITRNERELWIKLSEKAGVSLSEFILHPIREKHPAPKNTYKKLNRE